MITREIAPEGVAPPAAAYALARLTTGTGRWLHSSGIVAIRPDGTIPDDIVAQAEVIWDSLAAILADADMAPSDIVSVITYVIPGHDLVPVMAVRDRALGGHLAASTLVVVAELVRPEWLLEIAVVAVAAPP